MRLISGILAVSDYRAGKIVAAEPIGMGVDGAGYDPATSFPDWLFLVPFASAEMIGASACEIYERAREWR